MQVSGLGVGQTASSLYANEGVASFWKGLGFAWGREIFYTSIKLGGEWRNSMFTEAFGVDLLAFSTTSGTKRKYNYFFWISRNDDSMASEMEKQVFASWLSNFFVSFVDVAYAPVRDYLGAGPDAPFYMKFLAGAITGGVGSVVGMSFCCWVFSLFLFRLSFSSKSWQ